MALSTAGCVKQTRRIETPPPVVAKTAALEDLTAIVERFTQVQSLKAVVTLQLTYLNDDRTKENIVMEVNGAIVAERPDKIRVQAQVPVTKQKAFDMVSNEGMFRVYLTFKDRFFEGSTASQARSEKRSENIRPQHIFEPLLVAPLADAGSLALDVVREGGTPYYVIQELAQEDGHFGIPRKFWFSRADLQLSRLEIRDKEGELATAARYSGWTNHGELLFPETVVIDRPVDGYTLTVKFVKPGINETPGENAFVLEAPEGVKVEHINEVADAVAEPNQNP